MSRETTEIQIYVQIDGNGDDLDIAFEATREMLDLSQGSGRIRKRVEDMATM